MECVKIQDEAVLKMFNSFLFIFILWLFHIETCYTEPVHYEGWKVLLMQLRRKRL